MPKQLTKKIDHFFKFLTNFDLGFLNKCFSMYGRLVQVNEVDHKMKARP